MDSDLMNVHDSLAAKDRAKGPYQAVAANLKGKMSSIRTPDQAQFGMIEDGPFSVEPSGNAWERSRAAASGQQLQAFNTGDQVCGTLADENVNDTFRGKTSIGR